MSRSSGPGAQGRPKLAPLRLGALEEAAPGILGPGEHFEGMRFGGAGAGGVDVEGRDLSGASFAECELLDWSAHDANLQGVRFIETRIARMNAPALGARRTTLRETELDASRLGAVSGTTRN